MNYWTYPGINKSALVLAKQNIKPRKKKEKVSNPGLISSEPFYSILEAVSAYTGIPIASILGTYRGRTVVHARHLAIYFVCRYFPEISLVRIGSRFGDRDHSTVIHAKKSISDLCDVDKEVKTSVFLIDKIIKSKLTQNQAA